MKIYKSNLNELLAECKPPFYLSVFRISKTSKDGAAFISWNVTVAGFNEHRQCCELVLATETCLAWDENTRTKSLKQANQWEQEIRTRLAALDLELRDGRLSEDPVLGTIDA